MTDDRSPTHLPPAWFSQRIRAGLRQLYALSLEGCPGADIMLDTAKAWIGVLWAQYGRAGWTEADGARLETAFTTVAQNARRWPTPADLRAAVPARAVVPLAAASTISPALRARRQARLDEVVALLAGKGHADVA